MRGLRCSVANPITDSSVTSAAISIALRARPHRWPAHLHLHLLQAHDWVSWTTFVSVALPLLVGSVMVAISVALLTYLLLRYALARTRRTASE